VLFEMFDQLGPFHSCSFGLDGWKVELSAALGVRSELRP